MLEPRQADVLPLFLFLVVLPVVVYILLGKWGEASKRKEKISLLVQESSVESFGPEVMAAASVIPLVPPPTASIRECARCHGPATTRCSRCKAVRYCSGKCQIIHWRQGHKEECQPPDNMNISLKSSTEEQAGFTSDISHRGPYPKFLSCPSEDPVQEQVQYNVKSPLLNPSTPAAGASCSADLAIGDGSQISKPERRISEKRMSRKFTKELDSNDRVASVSGDGDFRTTGYLSKEAYTQKLRGSGSLNSEDGFSEKHGVNNSVASDEYTDPRCKLQQHVGMKNQNRDSFFSAKRCMNATEIGADYSAPNHKCLRDGSNCMEEILKRNNSSEMIMSNGNTGSKTNMNGEYAKLAKSVKSMSRGAREYVHSTKVKKGHGVDESVNGRDNLTSAHSGNGTPSIGLKVDLKKSSKPSRQTASEVGIDGYKKVKVLFPYEELIRFYEHEIVGLAPRGLMNCGNSCYANAVLQCLTCTKPLVMYLLSRTHSKACCLKNWCLMCELEQHVMMLKEVGGPLSPSRILSHIRRINCQIGDGSQEDAHEFLRLLVASMQSICLEELGGENQVHPSLQETTFVQQTFGGRLRSMVKCLRCHHESERYENIMDLTLEIFGWVESLEDALTQFTNPEDLDGENMYRCGRCASYVRARKQLSIDEAPNILTIVLKRFQEGNYGKINKCISFPEMLDMIPFMTGTNDIPPLYMLYGVVVHVDTLNASFSGHYVSYVKDLQGNWFRIDDSVVQPVQMSQVMSEGAYILFYMRSYPRPPRGNSRKATRQLAAKSLRHSVSKAYSSSEMGRSIHRASNGFTPVMESFIELNGMEFSDATSSDWSLFTSSDEASFTSESTRDSFSTADYSDTCHLDPYSSKFTSCTRERPSQRTISCRMFSGSKPVTRYVSEQTGYILDSDHTMNPLDGIQLGGNTRQFTVPFNEAYLSNSGYQNFVNYESNPDDGFSSYF